MECFVVGEDFEPGGVTYQKWSLIQKKSNNLWSGDLRHVNLNGDLKSFFAIDSIADKVVLLACHCELINNGSDRHFYNFTNEFTCTYKQIETLFNGCASQRLFLWVLTCENANSDVLVNVYNRSQPFTAGAPAKLICPRAIVSELMGRSFGVTDAYIFEVLNKYFEESPAFPDRNRNEIRYKYCHLEFGLELKLDISDQERSIIYGGSRDSLLQKWVTELGKGNAQEWLLGPLLTSNDLITWKSSVNAPAQYRDMEIHSHVKVHNGSRVHDNIHAKQSKFSKLSMTINGELYQHLSKAATSLLDEDKDLPNDSTHSLKPSGKVTQKEARSEEFKKQCAMFETTEADDA